MLVAECGDKITWRDDAVTIRQLLTLAISLHEHPTFEFSCKE